MFNINKSISTPSLSQVSYSEIEQCPEEEFTLKDKKVLSGNSVWILGHQYCISPILQKNWMRWFNGSSKVFFFPFFSFFFLTFKQMAEIMNRKL